MVDPFVEDVFNANYTGITVPTDWTLDQGELVSWDKITQVKTTTEEITHQTSNKKNKHKQQKILSLITAHF